MKRMFLMTAVMIGFLTAFAQKIDNNEAKALQAFLNQPAEKHATNAQALQVTNFNDVSSIDGVTVVNGHVTEINWKNKGL